MLRRNSWWRGMFTKKSVGSNFRKGGVARDAISTSKSRGPHRRHLGIESLEGRRLLASDVVAASFAADGDDFLIQYDIQSQAATAFDVAVYRSQDGTTLDAQVASQRVTDSADLAVGMSHSLTLSFTATDVAEEYSLILVVDASSEVSESNESNNQLEFSGGVFQDAADVVHVHGSSGSDTISAAPAAGSTVDVTWDSTTYNYAAANFDGLHIRTQEGASTTTVNSSLTETVWFFGGTGADVFTSGGGDDLLYGGLGDDTLSGGAGDDYIVGDQRVATDDGGRDELNGGAGNDLLTGDHDSNTLDTLAGGDWLDGGSGDDELYATHTGFYDAGTAEADELDGGDDDDLLVGSADADLLEGGAGDDTIYAGYGDDTIYGGTDADTLYAEGGDDLVYGDDANANVADGDDYISAGEGVDEVHAGGGDDLVYGGDGPDTMHGDDGDDQLYGQGGSDQLYGGDGADELDGGASADFLYGGNGNDTLIDLSEADTIDGGLGLDSDEFVDDGSADFSTSGTWTADLGGALYGQQLQAPSGTGSSYARWAFDDLPSGSYMAYATWDVTVGAATNAPFKVLDEVGGTTLQAVSIDQTNAPIGNEFLGRKWVPLGGFDVTDGDLVVELSDLADGMVLADSVRLESLTTGSNTLSISPVSPALSEIGSAGQALVLRGGSLSSSLVVSLSSSDTSEVTVPASVTIPAGQTSAIITLTPQDDTEADGTISPVITASASGYTSGQLSIQVTDDEPAAPFSAYIDFGTPMSPVEPGYVGITYNDSHWLPGAVSLGAAANSAWDDLYGDLCYFKSAELAYPVPAGTYDVTLWLGDGWLARDDMEISWEGDVYQTVDADLSVEYTPVRHRVTTTDGFLNMAIDDTGGANDWASIRAMTIEQAEAMPELSIEGESSAMEEVGGEIEFTLTRAGDLRGSLVVDLSVDDSTEASVSSQVTFLANESTAAFTLWAVTDAVQDGSQDVRVFAKAEGYLGVSSLVSVDETIETQFIVNDSAIAGSDLVGTWTSTGAGGSYSSGHLEDGNTGKGTKSATFRPDIDVPGNFDVYIWNTIVTNGSSDVPVDIVHQSGTTTIDVDQAGSAAGWMRLGTFAFAAGTTGAVMIRNDDSGGVVVADAVKWQRVSTATDQTAPVATLASPGDGEAVNVTSLNSTGYLDVTFADSGEGIDAASITDSGAEISVSGLTITGTPTLVSGTTYRYAFTGTASTGAMQVDFAGGSFADQVGNVNVAASETIYVEPGTVGDIAATAFAVASGKLQVAYDVIGVAATAFQVGVYSTVDGVTPGTLLQSQSVSTPSLLAVGTGHVVSFTATFAQQNFAHSLLALVNSTNVSREQTLSNNSALLDSGVFQASNGTVHVYGNGTYDSISATEVGSDLRINLNTAETIFTASTVTALHVQVGAGGSDVDLSAADSVAAYVFTGSGVDDVELGDTSSVVDSGAGNDTIDGGAGADVLVGGAGDDTISGGAGNDEITGGDGADLLYGNADDDELYGNDGADTIYGGLGDDYIEGGDGGGILVGDLAVGDSSSGGDDEIHGGSGVDVIVGDQYSGSGTGGDDLLYGYDSDDSLNGGSYDNLAVAGSDYFDAGSGDDVITTGSGVNTVFAGIGDDVVYGGDGADTVYAGAGNDVVNTAGGGGVVDGGAGDDELNGGSGADALSGGSGDDVLKGGVGDDTLDGDAGNDSLFGQLGDDTMTGGAGDDWLFGSEGDDLLYGDEISGGTGNDYIFGDSGDDWIHGADGANNLFGGSGEDEIHSGDDEDYILGGSGNDYINGGGGGGTLVGDSLLGQGGYGDDTIIGGSGADLIIGDYLKNDDTGIGGNDVIFAGDGDDEVYGDSKQGEDNAGVDSIDSGAGDDVVYGGGGNDEIVAGLGDDLVYGETGNDRMEGGLGDDTLWGGSGNDQLYGDDAVQGYGGSGGDDFLNGGNGDDLLVGNLGGDILDGNAGRDQLDPGEEVGDGIWALPTIDTIFAVAQGIMTVITGTVTCEFAGEATITLTGGVVATIHVTESGWFAIAIPWEEFIPSTSIAAVLTDGEGTESVTKIFFHD